MRNEDQANPRNRLDTMNTKHATQPTPGIGWVLEKMAEKTAKPITPYGAWLSLRRGVLAAMDAADARFSAADSASSSDAAWAEKRAAQAALREFDRKHPKPSAAKQWKDMGANDPLLRAIFGDKK